MYLVTGASFGIGKAVAINLASRGFPVLAVARSSQQLGELAARFPLQIRPVSADLSTQDGPDAILSAMGQSITVSGLVHSAGSRVVAEPFHAINTEDLIDHFRVHVASQIRLTQILQRNAAVHRVLFIDSYSASEPRKEWGAYSIIKAAAQMAARCAAQELGHTVTVRVFPGAVKTGVVEAVIASKAKASEAFSAMERAGKVARPEDVAEFIAAILVDTTDDLVQSVDAWDYNNLEHRALILAPNKNMHRSGGPNGI